MSLMDPAAPASGQLTAHAPAKIEQPIGGTTASEPPATSVPDRAPRHERGGDDGQRRPWRFTIGAKVGVLIAALFVVLVGLSTVLILQNRTTAREYDAVINVEGRQALLARQMQVEFKKQVQEWKNVLLRGSDREDLLHYSAAFEEQDTKVHALFRELLASSPSPELTSQVQRLIELDRTSDAAYDKALKAFVASRGEDYAAADDAVRGIDRPATELVDTIVAGLEAQATQRVDAQRQLTAERQRLTVILSASLMAMLAFLLVLALIRIVRPIRQLTRQADQVASEQLPSAISRIKAMQAGDEPPALPAFAVSSKDELHDLAESLTSLQESALTQAIEQHRADRETADMLVNLGRRNQNLLGRMLSYVTELERKEQDPDVLSQLFRLDHATTRIRRNAESMLVLAGATQTRTWSRPVPVIDVIRAALSEIEEYVRVDLHHVEESLVNGTAVADVVHLIAELVENATHFSPPTTQVTVVGQRVREGYRIRVIDQGVGMTRRELDEANQRIQRSDGGWADSKLLGLYVVGRLARRRSIDVALEPSAGRGITASILLPGSVLAVPGGVGGAAPSAAIAGGSANGSGNGAGNGAGSGAGSGHGGGAANASAMSVAMSSAHSSVQGPAPSPGPAPSQVPAPAPALGWSAPTGPADPWAGAEPPVQATPRRQPDTFSASGPSRPGATGGRVGSPAEPPRPTIPAALVQAGTGTGTGAAGESGRVIDLTERSGGSRPGGIDPGSATPGSVQWFDGPNDGSGGASAGPAAGGGSVNGSRGPAVAAAGGAPSGVIPRRVRGAQLPDLGPAAEPVIARPEEGPGAAESLRWQLRSFQLDVQAARRAINEPDPRSTSGTPHDHLDEKPGPDRGHHPESE